MNPGIVQMMCLGTPTEGTQHAGNGVHGMAGTGCACRWGAQRAGDGVLRQTSKQQIWECESEFIPTQKHKLLRMGLAQPSRASPLMQSRREGKRENIKEEDGDSFPSSLPAPPRCTLHTNPSTPSPGWICPRLLSGLSLSWSTPGAELPVLPSSSAPRDPAGQGSPPASSTLQTPSGTLPATAGSTNGNGAASCTAPLPEQPLPSDSHRCGKGGQDGG